MTHRQLIFFYQVYKNKNIVHVAEEMYISPQGISKTLIQLEKELGIKLFERSGNRMIPTDAAEELIKHVKIILEEYAAISEKNFCDTDNKKTVRILSTYDVLKKIPTDFFKKFSEKYPNIILHFDEMPDNDIIYHLNRQEVEIALLPGPFEHNSYDSEILFTSKFCYLINKKDTLSRKKQLSFSDLSGRSLAVKSTKHPLSRQHLDTLVKEGIDVNVFVEISDSETIRRIAEDGLAIGMTLDYLAEKADRSKVKAIPSRYFEKTIHIFSLNTPKLSHEAKLFRKMLLSCFGNI